MVRDMKINRSFLTISCSILALTACGDSSLTGLPAPDQVVADPVVSDPVATDPVVTDPVVTDPVVTDPVVTDPVVIDPVEPINQSGGALVSVGTGEDFLNTLRQGIEAAVEESTAANPEVVRTLELTSAPVPEAALAPAASQADAASSENVGDVFTTTYTLEVDVDEYDIVKYNGEHMFIARSVRAASSDALISLPRPVTQPRLLIEPGVIEPAFIEPAIIGPALIDPANIDEEDEIVDEGPTIDVVIDEAAPDELLPIFPILPILPISTTSEIRVLTADTEEASVEEVTSIELDSGDTILGMYLQDDQLVTLSSSQFYGSFGSSWLDYRFWSERFVNALFHDVSDAESPEQTDSISIEGALVQSRRIDDKVYFVTRHTPVNRGFFYQPFTLEQEDSNETVLDELSIEEVIPKVVVNGVERDLFDPQSCFVASKEEGEEPAGYPVITSITAVSMSDPSDMNTVCYNESADGVYMSTSAIYITQIQYDSEEQSNVTNIHKFALGEDIDYRGSGRVKGHIWTGGQNDFRINEYNDQLRIVTSTNERDSNDRTDHHVYILEESEDSLALELVAQLPNEERPQEIGKPNESLYGVRFFGDRAYLVTFERIDPLYILDLSNPADPFIAGELEVPGFSDFLHPVNDDLLLGLGADRSQVKLELFDISEPSQPASLSVEVIGEEGVWAYSQAQYDRRAFTYLAEAELDVDRFSIPVQTSGGRNGVYISSMALHLFEIRDKTTPNLASMEAVGTVEAKWPEDEEERLFLGTAQPRSIFHNDAVFFINRGSVWSALWTNPKGVIGPQ